MLTKMIQRILHMAKRSFYYNWDIFPSVIFLPGFLKDLDMVKGRYQYYCGLNLISIWFVDRWKHLAYKKHYAVWLFANGKIIITVVNSIVIRNLDIFWI